MSLITCAKPACGRVLSWKEIEHNQKIERRKHSSEYLCTQHGREDFEKKLNEVKARQQGRVVTMD